MISRRQFLKGAAIAGAGFALPFAWDVRSAYPFAQSPKLSKFITTLPGLGPAGANNIGQYIPLATKHTIQFAGKQTDLYDVAVTMFSEKMHPNLPGKTRFFGYTDIATFDQKYLAGVIVAQRGTPVLLTVTNLLPPAHILPVDDTIMAGPNGLMVGDLPYNRIATHLHGGLTPWFSDGTPFQWFTPSGMNGECFYNVPGTTPPPGTATYYYPNEQSARMVWYHDHAMGITRLNAYAGIASAYIITDDFESYLLSRNPKLLPDLVGIPLVIQDKTFWDTPNDPHYKKQVPGVKPGDLWYPWEYEKDSLPKGKGRVEYGPDAVPPATGIITPLPAISAVPEFFADTAMVNGAPYPELSVTEGTFRLRILNASQARFWHLNLYEEIDHTGEPNLEKPGPAMYQIGTESGFLPAVAIHDNKTPCPLDLASDPTGNTASPDGPFNLLLAPAERADILIDFTRKAGKSYILYSDAPGPFPGGDPRNDYYTGDPDFTHPKKNSYGLSGGAPPTKATFGPNTRTIMRIKVGTGSNGFVLDHQWKQDMNKALAANFAGSGNPKLDNGQPVPQQDKLLATLNGTQYVIPPGTKIYNKTLNEDFDEYGRLLQRGGTDQPSANNNQGLITFGQGYLDSITEEVKAGEIQAWDFYNTTMDTHPWHFHLVNVQVVGRGIYAVKADGTPDFGNFTDLDGAPGKLTQPNHNELGWKETVRMNPGEITRVIMQFNLPTLPLSMGDPESPRTRGHEYVHHCHILEHEEHDMMRALVVKKK
jgi:spore coat protein A